MVAKIACLLLHRLTMDLICTRTPASVGTFRQSYDVQACLVLTGSLAEAVQACGLPPGEKAHGIKDKDLEKIRQGLRWDVGHMLLLLLPLLLLYCW